MRRAALGAASSDDDSEDGEGKFAAGWGKNRWVNRRIVPPVNPIPVEIPKTFECSLIIVTE